jgi:O-antigen/teichoic acid export membrane protein
MLRNKKYAHISIAKVMLSLGLNLSQVLLGYITFGIEGLVIGWISGWLLSVFVLRLFGKFPFDFKLPLKELKTIARKYKDFPTINALHAFSDIFFAQVVLLGLITSNYGVAITGVFLMMDKYLRAPVRLVGSSVGQLYYKEAAQLKNEGQSPVSIFNRSIGITTLFAIPFLVVILMWGPDIYEWYLTSKFRASGELAQVMAIPLAMNLIVSPLSSTPLIYNQQKKAFALNLIGYGLSLGSLFYAVSVGESIEVSIKYYAAGMFVYYVVLLIWYRYLIRSKS